MSSSNLLSTEEAAIYLFGCASKKSRLEQFRYRNIGPKYKKIGRFVRYAQSDLDDFLAKNTFTGTGQQQLSASTH